MYTDFYAQIPLNLDETRKTKRCKNISTHYKNTGIKKYFLQIKKKSLNIYLYIKVLEVLSFRTKQRKNIEEESLGTVDSIYFNVQVSKYCKMHSFYYSLLSISVL